MLTAAATLALSIILTGLYRALALRSGWLDQPNHRSSHRDATPRGAGAMFGVLILILAWLLLAEQPALRNSLLIGAAIIAIGWWDDIRGVSARARFAVYAFACAVAVGNLVVADSVDLSLPFVAYCAAAVIGLLWCVNLYNFMDGINGIAATQALFVLGSALLLGSHDMEVASDVTLLMLSGIGAIGGFLLWNFPCAKVFMGDAGSAFLGFFLGVLLLSSTHWGGPGLAAWLILLGVFLTDATYTLITRLATGQQWHQAHRLHAYQKLANKLQSHARTVSLIMAVNLLWLLPWAWLVERELVGAMLGITAAYLPLLALCRALEAGTITPPRV